MLFEFTDRLPEEVADLLELPLETVEDELRAAIALVR
jgi:hypothetical protein